MRLSELNPAMTQTALLGYEGCNQLTFDCPLCGGRVQIYCHLNKPADPEKRIWKWSYDVIGFDSVTIEPSIGNHPVSNKSSPCVAHFTIAKGEVKP